MKYVQYTSVNDAGTQEGVCHKSKLEFLAVEGTGVNFTPISDEKYAELVDSWGGIETAPAAKAKPKKVA